MKFSYELNRSTAKHRSIRNGNEMISSNDRLCPHVKADITAYLRTLSHATALSVLEEHKAQKKEGHIPFSKEHPCHVVVLVCPPTKRRMDAPNWYPTVKALIDGLTDADVFADDNNDVIRSMTFVPGPKTDNKKYRIEIDIREGECGFWQI